jgi:cell division protein FtsA
MVFEAQKAMRRHRQAAMSRGLVAVLDVGTHKTACLVLRFEPAAPQGEGVGQMAGQSNFQVVGSAVTRSRGVRYGEVDSMPETERAIRTAVQAAQRTAGARVDHVIAAFSGGRPESWGASGEIPLDAGPCTVADVARVLAEIETPEAAPGRETLHAQPVNFGIDHRTSLRDPRGQTGAALAADIHMLTVDAHAVANLLTCLARCDLEVAGLASAPYAAAAAALVEDERELGAACVDMGEGTTGLSIFFRRHMVHADTIRMGGGHVTSDIGQGLRLPNAEAEAIKVREGGVVATGRDDLHPIELRGETGDWSHDRRTVTRGELIGIIRPRVEEILEEVRHRLEAAGFFELPSRRVVLTGGASRLPGLDEFAGRVLGAQVRLGRPMRVRGLPELAKGPAFSAAVGLALQAAEPQDEFWDFDLAAQAAPRRSMRRAMRWFSENW